EILLKLKISNSSAVIHSCGFLQDTGYFGSINMLFNSFNVNLVADEYDLLEFTLWERNQQDYHKKYNIANKRVDELHEFIFEIFFSDENQIVTYRNEYFFSNRNEKHSFDLISSKIVFEKSF